jgi:hypothetical protein
MKDFEEFEDERPIGRLHTIVEKDFYRLLKAETQVNKALKQKQAKELGRCYPYSLLNKKTAKYKDPQAIISQQYERSELPEDRLYMIDKVVRMRGRHGRFGCDHSELLNYEIE